MPLPFILAAWAVASASAAAAATAAAGVAASAAAGAAAGIGASAATAAAVGSAAAGAVGSVSAVVGATVTTAGTVASGAAAAIGASTATAVAVGTVAEITAATTIVSTAGKYAYEHTPAGSFQKSFVDNVFKDKVVPVVGSILHCALFGADHTGIYIGNGEIVELQGNGSIRATDVKGFMEGTNAISIYVACNKQHQPLGGIEIARRAEEMLGTNRQYNIIMDNCHQFTTGCITGNFENSNNFFTFVEDVVKRQMNKGKKIEWRVWDV